MDIEHLRALGAFAAEKPEAKTITVELPDGEAATIDLHLKALSAADQFAAAKADPDDQLFVIVQRLVVHENGQPVFTLDQVKSLAAWLLIPLMEAVGGQAPKKLPSTPPTSSGSN